MSTAFLPVEGDEASIRDWFHQVVNARENPVALQESLEWIQQSLAATGKSPLPPFCKGGLGGIHHTPPFAKVGLGGIHHAPPFAKVGSGGDSPKPDPSNVDLIAYHAPLALLEGAWLQSVALAANEQNETVNKLFACYLTLLGKDESDSPAFAYRGWLNLCQISLPQASAWRFAHDTRLSASALYFSCLQLALGLHSGNLSPEALGFTLAYLKSESPWRLPALPVSKRNAVLAAMTIQAESTLKAFSSDGKKWPRICAGFNLYQINEINYLNGLQTFLHRRTSLAGQVTEIFRRKLRFAQGYHASVKLGNRGLEEWFAEKPFDAVGFLDALASSHYVQGKKGQRLFDRLTGCDGPMFGVFDKEELDLMNGWLDGVVQDDKMDIGESNPIPSDIVELSTVIPSPADNAVDTLLPPNAGRSGGGRSNGSEASDLTRPHPNPPPMGEGTVELNLTVLPGNPPCPPFPRGGRGDFFDRIDNRTLFHLLINRDMEVKTQTAAQRWVRGILARTSPIHRGKAPFRELFFDYSPQTLAQRIVQLHTLEVSKHKPFQAPPKLRREEYIWGIRQFAPAILVDGCWLQHTGEAVSQDCRTQRLLFRIYAEELGGGIIDLNHRKIYRDLLDDLGIHLAQVEAVAFARDSSLLEAAFDLPCYLLAISQYPRTYFPEILGLNLAIELSGLGGDYMRLADELRYWNIEPRIVTLHLSIDNLAGGHAAMACEAIQLYMDEILSLGGVSMQNKIWQRVWSGYLSLNTVTQRFKWSLMLGFCRNFLPQRLFSVFQKLF